MNCSYCHDRGKRVYEGRAVPCVYCQLPEMEVQILHVTQSREAALLKAEAAASIVEGLQELVKEWQAEYE